MGKLVPGVLFLPCHIFVLFLFYFLFYTFFFGGGGGGIEIETTQKLVN